MSVIIGAKVSATVDENLAADRGQATRGNSKRLDKVAAASTGTSTVDDPVSKREKVESLNFKLRPQTSKIRLLHSLPYRDCRRRSRCDLYYAQPLIASIGKELVIKPDLAGSSQHHSDRLWGRSFFARLACGPR